MSISKILESARERGKKIELPYNGALLPQEAFQLMQDAPAARMVDVRTRPELDYVGRIPGAIEIELLTYPGNRPNSGFLAALEQQVDKEALVMFICRSGGRSHHAAILAMRAGYTECYNVLEGFEGERDEHGHRGTKGGWRKAGLPWVQG